VVVQIPTIAGNLITGSRAIPCTIHMRVAGVLVEGNAIAENHCGGLYLSAASRCAPANSTCGERVGAFDVDCSGSPTQAATRGCVKALYRKRD
jgi:hypothetical protein